jgi:hypothetical protein
MPESIDHGGPKSAPDGTIAASGTNAVEDAVVRHILRSIVTKVQSLRKPVRGKGPPLFPITDTLAAFVVRATVLNPHQGFRLEAVFSKNDVDRLIDVRFCKWLQAILVVPPRKPQLTRFHFCTHGVFRNPKGLCDALGSH